MFGIKICGITNESDGRAAVHAGASAIGLNFYEKSSRYVSTEQAKAIVDSLPENALKVGVFVNSSGEDIRRTYAALGLDAAQLHGDEPPEMMKELRDLSLVRARRMDERGVAGIAEDLEACRAVGRVPDAMLIDACTPGRYGGTGETVSWAGLANYRRLLGDVPLILAGGLTPENVAEAIRIVQPYGVDVASGVEISPGVKCPEKMRLFLSRAKAAFEAL